MRLVSLALTACLLVSSTANAKEELPPEPVTSPDWEAVAQGTASALRASLIDPESATVEWVSGFRWGYRKPVIGRRKFGWLACDNYNARNRFGGYVGAQGLSVLHTIEGDTTIFLDSVGGGWDTCIRGAAPINPELVAATSEPVNTLTFSVADELTKLANLLDRGLITEGEFAAQKAQLLKP